jgi:hypothetical protein
MDASKRPEVPYGYPHSGFQKLQTMQAEMRVTEPAVLPERAAPQSEGNNIQLNMNMFKQNYICTRMCIFVRDMDTM